ncbi:hypothetical protein WG66_014865 [Moniliophthora roreri]|nr:hypothetical protein WG66_014865 [Moniliophthora roreri]
MNLSQSSSLPPIEERISVLTTALSCLQLSTSKESDPPLFIPRPKLMSLNHTATLLSRGNERVSIISGLPSPSVLHLLVILQKTRPIDGRVESNAKKIHRPSNVKDIFGASPADSISHPDFVSLAIQVIQWGIQKQSPACVTTFFIKQCFSNIKLRLDTVRRTYFPRGNSLLEWTPSEEYEWDEPLDDCLIDIRDKHIRTISDGVREGIGFRFSHSHSKSWLTAIFSICEEYHDAPEKNKFKRIARGSRTLYALLHKIPSSMWRQESLNALLEQLFQGQCTVLRDDRILIIVFYRSPTWRTVQSCLQTLFTSV